MTKKKVVELEKDVFREDVVEQMKESYYQEDLIMSEFLRSCDCEGEHHFPLSLTEKRELLHYSGDDAYMVILENGEIVSKEDVYEKLVTGLNLVVEALGYDVDEHGFGYSEDGLACICDDNIDSFEEGFDWLVDELSGGYGSGPEGFQTVNGLNIAMQSLGIDSENGSEFVFEGIDEIYYMNNGNKTSMEDGVQVLKMNLFEVGFLDLSSDTISFIIEGATYLVGWEKEFPDMLFFYDITGDYSIMGSKGALIEELQTINIADGVIQEFAKQADVLLKRHAIEKVLPNNTGLEEKISRAKDARTGVSEKENVGDKELYR